MVNSSALGLITSQQLAALRLSAFFSEASGLTPFTRRAPMATEPSLGDGTATEDGSLVGLAWEIATMAQSCAYLAIELQVWAERFCDLESTLPGLTYSQLSASTAMLRALLTHMQEKFSEHNKEEGNVSVSVISGGLAEAILSCWEADNRTITVAVTTRAESQETNDTGTAGDMR